MSETLLQVEDLNVAYHLRNGTLSPVRDVSLSIRAGEVLGVVGESGCGKSTLASAISRLLPPTGEITSGRIIFRDRDLLTISNDSMRDLRGREMSMIFQDPLTSLNPTFTVGTQLADVQRAHRGASQDRRVIRRRAMEVLEQVGIPDVPHRIDDYPHQFSGGMRQRIMFAMVLMLEPALLIADEPTSALDVTLEAQILELMRRLRETHGTAILLISHDLAVIAQMCDRVVVMYAGRSVEQADVFSLFERPRHPYTQALLAAIPSHRGRASRLATIPGRVPSLAALPPGCTFADRCPYVQQVCRAREPGMIEIENARVRCHIYDPSSGYDTESRIDASHPGSED